MIQRTVPILMRRLSWMLALGALVAGCDDSVAPEVDATTADGGTGDAGSSDAGMDATMLQDAAVDATPGIDAMVDDEVKAFPSAVGYGRSATGGRGGEVIHVTNTNSRGSGSLREALHASGSRTIVFDVGGTFSGEGDGESWDLQNGDFTIDGATAPGPIEIQRINLQINCSNVIVRNLVIRGGWGSGYASEPDCITVQSWVGHQRDIIIDRCSLAYAEDENFSIDGTRGDNAGISDLTVMRTISAHGTYGWLINDYGTQLSFVENFTPMAGGRNAPYSGQGHNTYEVINGLTYDPYWSLISVVYGTDVDVIGNYLRTNPNRTPMGDYALGLDTSADFDPSDSDVYASDNYSSYAFPDGELDVEWTARQQPSRVLSGSITTPYDSSLVPMRVLGPSGAGARPWDRDAIDTQLIAHFMDSTGERKGFGVSVSDGDDFANPPLSSYPASHDTDRDGMPNAWESTRGLDPDVADNAGDDDDDGYTNIEEYLFDLNHE